MIATTNYEGTTIDTVLYVQEDLCGTMSAELRCSDDDGMNAFGASNRSTIEFDVTAGSTYYLFVDGHGPGDMGDVEIALGYGGESPVSGRIAGCTAGSAADAYRFFVEAGDTLLMSADTLSSSTASDLCLFFVDTDGSTVIASFDDEVDCTHAPPAGRCPSGAIASAPTTGFVYAVVQQCSNSCVDPATSEYLLQVTRNGGPARLMQALDE
jgi:hypothetical protein